MYNYEINYRFTLNGMDLAHILCGEYVVSCKIMVFIVFNIFLVFISCNLPNLSMSYTYAEDDTSLNTS